MYTKKGNHKRYLGKKNGYLLFKYVKNFLPSENKKTIKTKYNSDHAIYAKCQYCGWIGLESELKREGGHVCGDIERDINS